MHERSRDFPKSIQGAGEIYQSEVPPCGLEIGVAESVGQDVVVRQDNLRIFGVFSGIKPNGKKPMASSKVANVVRDSYIAYTSAPRSEIEALERIEIAKTEVEESMSLQETHTAPAITLVKIEEINDRPYLVWVNTGSFTQLLVQQRIGGRVDAPSAIKPPGSDAPVGILPLRDNARVIICSDTTIRQKGHQEIDQVEAQSIFHLDDPQDAAGYLSTFSKTEREKSAVVVDTYADNKNTQQLSAVKSAGKIAPLFANGRSMGSDVKKMVGNARAAIAKTTLEKGSLSKEKISKAQRKLQKAKAAAFAGATATAYAMKDYFTNKEKGRRRRIGVVTALGVVASTYVAYKAGILGGGMSLGQQTSGATVNPDAFGSHNYFQEALEPERHQGLFTKSHLHEHRLAEVQTQQPVKFRLRHQGDGIWSTIESYVRARGYEDSNARIAKVVRFVMEQERITQKEAFHLPRGWEFSVPRKMLRA